MVNHNTATLLAVGDIGTQIEPTDELAALIAPVLRNADLRFGQAEKTYSELPVAKPDPTLPRGPMGMRSVPFHPRALSIWKTLGINIVSMASNHTMEWDGEVLLDTIRLFNAMGKTVVGAGKDIDQARKPAIVERNGVKIAFVAYCSVLAENHEARSNKPGIAPMRARTYYQRGGDPKEDFQPATPQHIFSVPYEDDLQSLQADIRNAKEQADVVVMSIHWGVHHLPKYIAHYQPVVAHAAIDAGADLILGHHPHCLKAVEVYKGKVCFYSIGNLIAPGGHKEHDVWGLYFYHVDPECMPPHGQYYGPRESRMTMVVKAIFNKRGVERVSFLPAFINPQAQPAVVPASDPKFGEILSYMEWVSEQYTHAFHVDGNEIVIETQDS